MSDLEQVLRQISDSGLTMRNVYAISHAIVSVRERDDLRKERDEWKQAASVEAGLRREFAAELAAVRKQLVKALDAIAAARPYISCHVKSEHGTMADLLARMDAALTDEEGTGK